MVFVVGEVISWIMSMYDRKDENEYSGSFIIQTLAQNVFAVR